MKALQVGDVACTVREIVLDPNIVINAGTVYEVCLADLFLGEWELFFWQPIIGLAPFGNCLTLFRDALEFSYLVECLGLVDKLINAA